LVSARKAASPVGVGPELQLVLATCGLVSTGDYLPGKSMGLVT